jgi:hypothetical protein
MLIRLPAELSLEQRVRVELDLGEPFRALARVVFLGPDFDGGAVTGAHRVGLAFVSAAPGDEDVLQRYIATLPPPAQG